MVEVCDLFAQVEIFQQGRPAPAAVQRVIGVADAQPVVRRQVFLGWVFAEGGELPRFALFVKAGLVVHEVVLSFLLQDQHGP